MFLGKLSLLFYYFVLSAVSVYAFCTLWLAAPPTAPADTKSVTAPCASKLGEPPQIMGLEPKAIAVGQNYASIAVVGCNFNDGAIVRFNGIERPTNSSSAELLNVPLLASDFAAGSSIGVSVQAQVVTKGANGNDTLVPRTSKVQTLPILAPGEVKVHWSSIFGRDRVIDVELRLILLVLLAGFFAACVFGLNSFVNYTGEEKLRANWLWLYFARPAIGSGVALVFYLIIRGGFLAGTNADIKAVNPFGFVAVAALVGMFSDAALMKLNSVFDTLFQARDTRKQGMDEPMIDAPDQLPAGKVNDPYRYEFKARNGGGALTWSTTSTLPAGLKLSSAGVLEGTPTAAASVTLAIQVKNENDKVAHKDCKLEIS